MTRKATKRKHWALLDPLERAKFQASKLTPAEWNEQMAPVITAVEQLMRGNWHPLEVWNKLFFALNRIESIKKLKHIDDYGLIAEAQAAFVTALDRHKTTGACSLKAPELATIREVVQVYGDLLGEISHRDFRAICDHTEANVQRIIRQKGHGTVTTSGCIIERSKSKQKEMA
jgi:hypothetical protein